MLRRETLREKIWTTDIITWDQKMVYAVSELEYELFYVHIQGNVTKLQLRTVIV